jgi:hypothetical protein
MKNSKPDELFEDGTVGDDDAARHWCAESDDD